MSIRLVAAAKGLVVGVLTLVISVAIWVVGGLAYVKSTYSPCLGTGLDPECNAEPNRLGGLFGAVLVLLGLMLVVGPLLAWGFLLPFPGGYVIPQFLTAFVDVPVLYAGLPKEFLVVAPLAAYPVIAALTAERRRRTRPGAIAG